MRILDTFTGTAGDLLTAHTSDAGAGLTTTTWTNNGGTTPQITAAGRLAWFAGESRAYANTEPTDAEYDLTWTVRANEIGTFNLVGVACCWLPGSGNYYRAYISSGGGNTGKIEKILGLSLQSGGQSGAVTISAVNTYECKLEVRSATLTLFYRLLGSGTWIQVCQMTDSALPRNTSGSSKVGMWNLTASTDTTGLQIDNWEYNTYVSATPDTTPPTITGIAIPASGLYADLTASEAIGPAASVTGLTCTVAGINRTFSSVVRQSTNVFRATFSSGVYTGESVVWAYAPGNIVDLAATPNAMVAFSGMASTNGSTVANPVSPLVAGTVLVTAEYPTITFTVSAPTGGTGPYTWQAYASADPEFTIGVGTLLAGATGGTNSFTPSDNEPRWIRVVYTDAVAGTVTTDVIGASLLLSEYVFGAIGDSTIAHNPALAVDLQTSAPKFAAAYLQQMTRRKSTVLNRALGGTTTQQWILTYLAPAMTAMAAAGIVDVYVQFAPNDVNSALAASVVAAGYTTRLGQIANTLVSNGFRPFLGYPMSLGPDGTANRRNDIHAIQLMCAGIDTLVNGTTIFAGSRVTFKNSLPSDTTQFFDRVHPTEAFKLIVGAGMALALYEGHFDTPNTGGTGSIFGGGVIR